MYQKSHVLEITVSDWEEVVCIDLILQNKLKHNLSDFLKQFSLKESTYIGDFVCAFHCNYVCDSLCVSCLFVFTYLLSGKIFYHFHSL